MALSDRFKGSSRNIGKPGEPGYTEDPFLDHPAMNGGANTLRLSPVNRADRPEARNIKYWLYR
jgi:hypothetical protein